MYICIRECRETGHSRMSDFERGSVSVLVWFILMALIVFADQLTKHLTVLYLKPISTLPLIEDVLHLTYMENEGAAFGMMADRRWIFMVVSTVAILLLIGYFLWKKPTNPWECVSLSFIIAGGIGNMIDRVSLGYVVDMIDVRLIHFAVFNVADSFVCVGAGILMVWMLVTGIQEAKTQKLAAKAQASESQESMTAAPGAEQDVVSEASVTSPEAQTTDADMHIDADAHTDIQEASHDNTDNTYHDDTSNT